MTPQSLRAFLGLRQSFVFVGVVALAIVASLIMVSPLRAQEGVEPDGAPRPAFVPGQLLVGMNQAEVSASAVSAFALASATQTVATYDFSGPEDDIVTVLIAVEPGTEQQQAEALQAMPGVVYAEPNWYVYAAQEPPATDTAADVASASAEIPFKVSDTFYASDQWHLQRIQASRAWQLAYDSDEFASPAETVVAVIDSGIDTVHPEFAGRIVPGAHNYVEVIEPTTGIIVPSIIMFDDCGHGTHIAGLIAAQLNNAQGVAGVATNVKIDARRVLWDAGYGCIGTVAAVAQSIRDAADDGADVINMSLEVSTDYTPFRDAVKYANSKGSLLIAAAGNRNTSVAYPARYPQVMAVAALTYNNQRAWYSDTGPEVEIAAPGGDGTGPRIFSTWSKDAVPLCATGPVLQGNGNYCTQYGTSQAAAIVSGAAALIRSLRPDLSASEVRTILRDSATSVGLAPELAGAGMVNVEAAARLALPSRLHIVPDIVFTATSSLPLTLPVRIENPSLDPVTWVAAVSPTDWLTLTTDSVGTLAGNTAWGDPAFLSLIISPSGVLSGTLSETIYFTGTRTDSTVFTDTLPVAILIDGTIYRTFWPLVMNGTEATTSAITSVEAPNAAIWLAPASEASRSVHNLVDESDISISMPFSVTLGSRTYGSIRLFSDGLIAFSSVEAPVDFAPADNACLPVALFPSFETPFPSAAVYPWWANLNPGAAGARVSTFSLGTNRFVVEFLNVPSVGASNPYTVSFQSVLYANGDVQLNYAKAPSFPAAPDPVTVGVQSLDGRFFNRVACATGKTILGETPRAGQSIFIRSSDLF